MSHVAEIKVDTVSNESFSTAFSFVSLSRIGRQSSQLHGNKAGVIRQHITFITWQMKAAITPDASV